MRHSYTFPAPDSSSMSVTDSYTSDAISSYRHHHPDFSRESSEYDFRSCYSSAASRPHYNQHHYSVAGSEAGMNDGGYQLHHPVLRDDLSGMLRTKMNLLTRANAITKDDHDSGHSSSGTTASNNSPAFFGVRHRNNKLEINNSHDHSFQHSLEDQSSMYSYCSARDRGLDEDSGVSSVTTLCTSSNNDNHVVGGGATSKMFMEDAEVQEIADEDQPTYWTPPPSSCYSRKSSSGGAPSSSSAMSHHEKECPPSYCSSRGGQVMEDVDDDVHEKDHDDNGHASTATIAARQKTCKKKPFYSSLLSTPPSSLEPSSSSSTCSSKQQWNFCRKTSLMVVLALGTFLLLTTVAIHDELSCQHRRRQQTVR